MSYYHQFGSAPGGPSCMRETYLMAKGEGESRIIPSYSVFCIPYVFVIRIGKTMKEHYWKEDEVGLGKQTMWKTGLT